MTSLPPGFDLSIIPVVPPPPGIVSNFVDPESLSNAALVVGILMLVLTIFVVIIRLFSNYLAPRGLGWDDCFCVTATAFFLVYEVTCFGERQMARHVYDIPLSWVTPSYTKRQFVEAITNAPMTFFAKSSLFMLYYRLFKVNTLIRYAIFVGLTLSAINYFSNMIVHAIMCSPRVGQGWNVETLYRCSQSALPALVRGIVNVVLDIFLLMLPIPAIIPLQLSVKKKIGILAVFMAGSFALVASIIGMIYQAKLSRNADKTWNGWICIICMFIETGLTITCSSAAALVKFWKSHFSPWIARLYVRFRHSRSTKLEATTLKVVSPPTSINETILPLPQPDQTTQSHRNWYNSLDHGEPDQHPQKSTGGSDDAIRTEIGGGTTPRSDDVEIGVIHQFIKLEQSSS